MEGTVAASKGRGEGNDIGLGGHAGGSFDGGVETESLADDGVEVREGVELVHGRGGGGGRTELSAEGALGGRVAREGVEGPGGPGRRGLVACDEKGGDLVQDLFNGELLRGGRGARGHRVLVRACVRGRIRVRVRVCPDEEAEEVLVCGLFEGGSASRGGLFPDGVLLLANELETDTAHSLVGLGD